MKPKCITPISALGFWNKMLSMCLRSLLQRVRVYCFCDAVPPCGSASQVNYQAMAFPVKYKSTSGLPILKGYLSANVPEELNASEHC